ncbi:YitT family protein [Aurantimonas sp. MSK8Z-1]|uniref:YitT family protein n=1 Tax=Mangrovibrevibacter kandeliae TaxID=2968473 RepID=UPI00211916D9|nr:YitT family protein [Aurantimonas sp. MSK8Z-1]MCW4116957.1 YitT family protein [Aurantimonas sp. MSK8Z-1]
MRVQLGSLGDWTSSSTNHTPLEDAQGLFTGVVISALSIGILHFLGLLTGGTAGLAFVITYATGWNFGLVFFVVNLPFYLLAIGRMGLGFTLKTSAAIALLSLITAVQPQLITFAFVDRMTGAILAGLLLGFGLLALFRHRASLGGIGILAFFCQETFGWRAGYVQLGFDMAILALSFTVLTPDKIAYSVLGALVYNLFLAINHRTDRYTAR